MSDSLLEGKRVILGVTGGIAAYKAADLCSKLVQGGAHVDVVMTEAATRFVAPLTFAALSGRAARVDMWAAAGGDSIRGPPRRPRRLGHRPEVHRLQLGISVR